VLKVFKVQVGAQDQLDPQVLLVLKVFKVQVDPQVLLELKVSKVQQDQVVLQVQVVLLVLKASKVL
jgi:hypothetical protein